MTTSVEFQLARDRVHALLAPGRLGPDIEPELLETHISWIILAGSYAYKIKKPVNFGFLDFSSLESREWFCHEEIRLNRRLAPDLYLNVVSITGSDSGPQLNGDGEVLEHAVRMRRFPQSAQLDKQLAAGQVTPEDLRTFARRLANFHQRAAVARGSQVTQLPDQAYSAAMDNIETILRSHNLTQGQRNKVEQLGEWTGQRFRELEPSLLARAEVGQVRECHGDLHLSNLVRLADGSVTAFDCIEFSNELRWIDVLNDAAFLVMDLMERNRPDLAYSFLNTYLEHSGDYQDLDVLRFFLVYRSLVRAKVALLMADIPGVSAGELARARKRCQAHLDLALRLSSPKSPCLILMRGFSGSGKSWISERLAMYLPGIRMRSDLVRKRMFGLSRYASTRSGISQGIYSPDASTQTYELLLENASCMLRAGFNVLVDASFLERAKRQGFEQLANTLQVDYLVLDVKAPIPLLRRRIVQRQTEGGDPSEAGLVVLEEQIRNAEGLTRDELPYVMGVTSRQDLDVDLLADSIRERLRKFPQPGAKSVS